jgi:ubiquinone/menaquinone biosynthesis C-methylase UbiE
MQGYIYTRDFYRTQQEGSLRSAREIVPLVLDLLQPHSVIDVGCGVGTWLSVFKECGIDDIFGVDGHYVDKEMLQIPTQRFLSFDLRQPFRMDRRFESFPWKLPNIFLGNSGRYLWSLL